MTKILCTGGAGSLGIAFATFLSQQPETEVTIIDENEWSVAQFDVPGVTKLLGDCFASDEAWLERLANFDLLIHCAAYKHVDLIEANQAAAEENNVRWLDFLYTNFNGGAESQTEKPILFISTDKAVEPASFYGRTKQRGEAITRQHGGVIARLGNIKHSTGSVIPRWEKAISDDRPLPVTDLAMTRYYIEASVAVARIWALLTLADPGDVIIPRMGAPIPLRQLVNDVLALHGKAPAYLDGEFAMAKPMSPTASYPVELIGRRPGEKQHEQLRWPNEETVQENEHGEIVRPKGAYV